MDWDSVMRNTARGDDFTGRSASDEQAYFEAFAGSEAATAPARRVWALGHHCASIIGYISASFVLR